MSATSSLLIAAESGLLHSTDTYTEKLWSVVERQSKVIGEIISLAFSLKRGASLALCSVDVSDAVENIVAFFSLRADKKRLTLNVNAPPNCIALSHRFVLQHHILGNLISNAIKFSFEGGIIDIEVKEDGAWTSLTVKDYGRGIPPPILSSIFSDNVSSVTGTLGEEGSGKGLKIVRSLLESLNGRLSISSVSLEDPKGDHGTVVSILLPKPQPDV
jgi:signal transduction histidine kinase